VKRLLALVLLLGVAGCGDDDSSGPDTGNQLVVGALLSLTGPGQTLGRTSEAALALAADDVNAQLTAQGSPVRVSLRVEDTGLDPTRALDRLRTLAGEGVRIFIGPQSSSEVNALKVFADSAGVILLSQGSTAGALSIPDDNVFRLVPEERCAWHAGVSFWKGRSELNGVSIGIEIVNPGHEFGYPPFPEAQIRAVIALIGEIRGRWTVDDNQIVGHSDVAPERKTDPGELFPWKRLAEAGHGYWAEIPAAPGEPLALGATGPGVFALQAGLTRLGYDCAPSGEFEPRTAAIVRAFQRRWRPGRVDGVADGETRARLIALLRLGA